MSLIKTFSTQFLIGGSIIGTTSVIAERFGSKWAALFWSIPFSFLPVLFMLYKRKEDWQSYVKYSIISSVLLLITFLGMVLSLKLDNEGFYKALLFGIILWGFASLFYIFLICPSPMNNKCIITI